MSLLNSNVLSQPADAVAASPSQSHSIEQFSAAENIKH